MKDKPFVRHIYLSRELGERLTKFVKKKYGDKRALSMVIQDAVSKYLEANGDRP